MKAGRTIITRLKPRADVHVGALSWSARDKLGEAYQPEGEGEPKHNAHGRHVHLSLEIPAATAFCYPDCLCLSLQLIYLSLLSLQLLAQPSPFFALSLALCFPKYLPSIPYRDPSTPASLLVHSFRPPHPPTLHPQIYSYCSNSPNLFEQYAQGTTVPCQPFFRYTPNLRRERAAAFPSTTRADVFTARQPAAKSRRRVPGG